MPLSFGFRPRLVPTVAAVAGIAITVMLGNWQLDRAAQKLALQQRIESAAKQPPVQLSAVTTNDKLAYYPAVVAGEFNPALTLYLDNRVQQGRVGYEILTPLKIRGTNQYVLIDRGWLPAGATRAQLPEVTTPTGLVTIEGIVLPGNPPVFELSPQVQSGRVWQNVTVERFERQYNVDLLPVMVYQQSQAADGLIREWRRPDVGIDRHRAYALQWFSLALGIVILYVVLNVQRTRQS
jgi:surfeit locus 1 family protein